MTTPTRTLSSKPKLRVIEPFRSSDGVRANVLIHSLGGSGCVIIEADTPQNEESEVVLSAREAQDLMLWLQCALSTSDETAVGHVHTLYAIESAAWVEEVGCEECDFKVVGKKAPSVNGSV